MLDWDPLLQLEAHLMFFKPQCHAIGSIAPLIYVYATNCSCKLHVCPVYWIKTVVYFSRLHTSLLFSAKQYGQGAKSLFIIIVEIWIYLHYCAYGVCVCVAVEFLNANCIWKNDLCKDGVMGWRRYLGWFLSLRPRNKICKISSPGSNLSLRKRSIK